MSGSPISSPVQAREAGLVVRRIGDDVIDVSTADGGGAGRIDTTACHRHHDTLNVHASKDEVRVFDGDCSIRLTPGGVRLDDGMGERLRSVSLVRVLFVAILWGAYYWMRRRERLHPRSRRE